MPGFKALAATAMPEIIPPPLIGTISMSSSGTCTEQQRHSLAAHFPYVSSQHEFQMPLHTEGILIRIMRLSRRLRCVKHTISAQ